MTQQKIKEANGAIVAHKAGVEKKKLPGGSFKFVWNTELFRVFRRGADPLVVFCILQKRRSHL